MWTISHAGQTVRLKDTRGVRYIGVLLRHPYRPLHAIELVQLACGVDPVVLVTPRPDASKLTVGFGGSHGEPLDAVAKAAYRSRLAQLAGEIDEAEALNDPGRCEQLQREVTFLRCELGRAVGLCAQNRCAGSAPERARVNAARGIAAVRKRLATLHPALGRHLDATIRTGTFCVYAPDPRLAIEWQF